MDTNKERKLSEKETKEWIPGCPLQIKKVLLTLDGGSNTVNAFLSATPCGNLKINSYTVDLELQDDRREPVGKMEGITKKFTDNSPIPLTDPRAVYATAIITKVELSDGTWVNETKTKGKIPSEQPIIWQTDPLYDQIKRECSGKVAAKYFPDTIEGAWRCTCGQINLETADACGNCRTEREWLNVHFDKEYLEKNNKEWLEKQEKEPVSKKKKKQIVASDKVKALALLAALLAGIGLIVFTFLYIIPSVRYSIAESKLDSQKFDEAYEIFADLGSFKDSADRMSDVQYQKALYLTGLDEVLLATTETMPWFTISEDGELAFMRDNYTGDWTNVIIPDLFNDTIVRRLSALCFANCPEMTSIKISDCVEEIGEQAFINCSILKNVEFGKNLKVIEHRAFIGCVSLEEITFPDSLEGTLQNRMFNNCSSLKKVTLGRGIHGIGAYAFSMCTALETLVIESPIATVGDGAFYECKNLKEIVCHFDKSTAINPEVGPENDPYHSAKVKYN